MGNTFATFWANTICHIYHSGKRSAKRPQSTGCCTIFSLEATMFASLPSVLPQDLHHRQQLIIA